MRAKEFLQQPKRIDCVIENKLAEKDQWKNIALGTTASGSEGERVQASGNQQKMENAIVKYLDIEKEIDQDIDRLIETKMDVIRVIEQLNPAEYNLLHKVYIQYFTLKEAAYKCDMSYSAATTAHGRALANVQRILDKRGTENE
jgi:DNA-directed RNA polymerase specialized sigma24 family protein